jgi:uncharacterized protein
MRPTTPKEQLMIMRCPRTAKPLRHVKVGTVTVDFSDACGGVFFDRFELQRFDDDIETAGELLAELMVEHEDSTIDFTKRIRCPKHPDVVMMRRFYSPKRGVEVDECPECGGIWLDAAELAEARIEQPNDADRKRATETLMKEVMNSAVVMQHEGDLAKAKTGLEDIARALWGIVGTSGRN